MTILTQAILVRIHLLPVDQAVVPERLSLLLRSLTAHTARFGLLLLGLNFVPAFETMFRGLNSLLLLKTLDKCVLSPFAHESGRWYLGRIANNEIVYVVIVDDVGDVACRLLHTWQLAASLLLSVSDRRLFALFQFTLILMNEVIVAFGDTTALIRI